MLPAAQVPGAAIQEFFRAFGIVLLQLAMGLSQIKRVQSQQLLLGLPTRCDGLPFAFIGLLLLRLGRGAGVLGDLALTLLFFRLGAGRVAVCRSLLLSPKSAIAILERSV